MLAAETSLDSVELWDLRRSRPAGPLLRVPRGENGSIGALAFDRAADVLAAATDDGTILLWDVAHRSLLGRPLHARGDAYARDLVAVTFVGGSRTLLAAAADGSVALADAGAVVFTPTVAFSPDGRVLASALATVRLWKGILWHDLPDLEAQVCGLVIGDLTKAEWAAIAPGLPYRTTCTR